MQVESLMVIVLLKKIDQKVALAFSFRTDSSGPPHSLSEIEQRFVILEE